jgi:hypothetical protein
MSADFHKTCESFTRVLREQVPSSSGFILTSLWFLVKGDMMVYPCRNLEMYGTNAFAHGPGIVVKTARTPLGSIKCVSQEPDDAKKLGLLLKSIPSLEIGASFRDTIAPTAHMLRASMKEGRARYGTGNLDNDFLYVSDSASVARHLPNTCGVGPMLNPMDSLSPDLERALDDLRQALRQAILRRISFQ